MNVDQFKKRFASARKKKQGNWETLYREAMEIFCPDREAFYKPIAGEKKGRQVYTSAPTVALDKAANNLHASLTPHMKKWVALKPGRLIPKENKETAVASLQEITQTLFDYIFASNFDLAISEFYKDVLIGTAALMVHGTARHPLIFTAVPIHELYICTGALGTVDSVFREYKIKAGAIEGTWDDANIDNELATMIKENPDKELEIVEGTIPKKIKQFNTVTEKDEEVDGFGYYVCMKKGGEGYLVERDMPVSPWIVSRWSVLSGEEWGRGPAVIALNDAKTMNQFVKLHMQSMELTVHPMYTIVDDGVINISAIRIGPGAMIPVSANDGVFGASIAPLRSGGNFQAGQIELQRLEGSINEQMYTEAIGSVTLPVKTATEISIRQGELSKRIGSAYGRLQYELVRPLINACLYHLDRLGVVNMNNFRVDGQNISVEAVSPLAMGQAQDEIDNLTTYVQFAVQAFGPEVAMSMLKPQEIMDVMAEWLNVPNQVKMSEEDKAQAQQLLQQLMSQQMSAQNAEVPAGGTNPPIQAPV